MYVVTCLSLLFKMLTASWKELGEIKALISLTKETYSKVSLSLSIALKGFWIH